MRCFNILVPVMALAACVTALAQGQTYNGLGRTPTQEEIQAWDISVGPEGKELPLGSGTVKEGAQIYVVKCAKCHGATGETGPGTGPFSQFLGRLVGGKGTLDTPHPVRTVGSYWPYATTLWDFISRAMPRGEAGTLSANEVYAVTAALLYWNGIIQETDVMDREMLPKVQMPNRNGFVPPHPDWKKYKECNPDLLKCAQSLIPK